ncbi:MAG: hypothetical protein JWQ03_2917, partial [Variovorax sp.]|nr:hypothetical protein [Variovorax sp.]
GEPLPLPARLAGALDSARLRHPGAPAGPECIHIQEEAP